MTYPIEIAGCHRELPLCRLTDDLMIAGFVIFGDVELTCACAKALLERAPEFDYILAPEAKAIPLAHEMARQSGRNDYFIARKKKKAYMTEVFEVEDRSLTTEGVQTLCIDVLDAMKMKDKRILLLDDVISTGGSISAVEQLVQKAGGIVAARMAILAEGDAAQRGDIIFLNALPLFDRTGKPLA